MNPLTLLALKAVAGGLGVVAFALLAEMVSPKTFAGLSAAEPAVALARSPRHRRGQGHRHLLLRRLALDRWGDEEG